MKSKEEGVMRRGALGVGVLEEEPVGPGGVVAGLAFAARIDPSLMIPQSLLVSLQRVGRLVSKVSASNEHCP